MTHFHLAQLDRAVPSSIVRKVVWLTESVQSGSLLTQFSTSRPEGSPACWYSRWSSAVRVRNGPGGSSSGPGNSVTGKGSSPGQPSAVNRGTVWHAVHGLGRTCKVPLLSGTC